MSYDFYVIIRVRVEGPEGGTNTTNRRKYPGAGVHAHMLQNQKCINVAPQNAHMHLIRWIIKT